jgi:hypothetical protein
VVVLSGADARVLRSLEAPTAGNSGFGWPVVLSGDINGDGTPELLVGTVGNDTGVALFNATTGVRLAAQTLGAGATTLRLLATASTVPSGPWSMVVANPTDGIHTYFWGQPEL